MPFVIRKPTSFPFFFHEPTRGWVQDIMHATTYETRAQAEKAARGIPDWEIADITFPRDVK
jgi:hypothetical protein